MGAFIWRWQHPTNASNSQGAFVRSSKNTTIFDKGYMPNWTKEHFTVRQTVPPRTGTKRRVYKLVDYNEEDVTGSWYLEKIQEITHNQYSI